MAILAAGVIGAGVSGFQMYQGHKQKKEGEKALAGLKRPEYEIPQELFDSLSDAEKREVEGLPAEQKKDFVKNVERSQQASLKASADRKGGLMGIQESINQETDAYTNLVGMDAAARKQSELDKRRDIERARGNIAGAKDRQFGVNQEYYNQDVTSAQGDIGAGKQNFMSGLQGVASSALQFGGAKYTPK